MCLNQMNQMGITVISFSQTSSTTHEAKCTFFYSLIFIFRGKEKSKRKHKPKKEPSAPLNCPGYFLQDCPLFWHLEPLFSFVQEELWWYCSCDWRGSSPLMLDCSAGSSGCFVVKLLWAGQGGTFCSSSRPQYHPSGSGWWWLLCLALCQKMCHFSSSSPLPHWRCHRLPESLCFSSADLWLPPPSSESQGWLSWRSWSQINCSFSWRLSCRLLRSDGSLLNATSRESFSFLSF